MVATKVQLCFHASEKSASLYVEDFYTVLGREQRGDQEHPEQTLAEPEALEASWCCVYETVVTAPWGGGCAG